MVKGSRSESDADEGLKRLGGGRWETRDGRFTIEPASGTWSVVDSQETDDLGLPLVRGPFRSLTDAKAAIATARETEAPSSPLAERVRERPRAAARDKPDEPAKTKAARPSPKAVGSAAPSDDGSRDGEATERRSSRRTTPRAAGNKAQAADGEEEREPGWLPDLSPADRGRARRLIERLTDLAIPDADSIVRRDLVGEVPAIAAAALERRLAALPADAAVADVVELLVDGRDDELGVRWRLVDGDARPILIDVRGVRRARR